MKKSAKLIALLFVAVISALALTGCSSASTEITPTRTRFTAPGVEDIAEILICGTGSTRSYQYIYTEPEQFSDFVELITSATPGTRAPKEPEGGVNGGGLQYMLITTKDGEEIKYTFGYQYFTQDGSGLYTHGRDMENAAEDIMEKYIGSVPGALVRGDTGELMEPHTFTVPSDVTKAVIRYYGPRVYEYEYTEPEQVTDVTELIVSSFPYPGRPQSLRDSWELNGPYYVCELYGADGEASSYTVYRSNSPYNDYITQDDTPCWYYTANGLLRDHLKTLIEKYADTVPGVQVE